MQNKRELIVKGFQKAAIIDALSMDYLLEENPFDDDDDVTLAMNSAQTSRYLLLFYFKWSHHATVFSQWLFLGFAYSSFIFNIDTRACLIVCFYDHDLPLTGDLLTCITIRYIITCSIFWHQSFVINLSLFCWYWY